jgi:hypothetical protein
LLIFPSNLIIAFYHLLSTPSSQRGIQAFTHFYPPLTALGPNREMYIPMYPLTSSVPGDTDTLLSA